MGTIIAAVEKLLQPVSNIIFFGLEVWVIFNQFSDLPGHDNSLLFWRLAAFVVTAFHLYLIIEIKTKLKQKNLSAIPLFIVYFLIVGLFFISSLAFTLKSIEKRAYNENLSTDRTEAIQKQIRYNDIAIEKYNQIISETNDIRTIHKFRNQLNDLIATNSILNAGLIQDTNTQKDRDSFTLIASVVHIDRGMLIFWFLCALWILFEVGLFMTAPELETKRKEEAQKVKSTKYAGSSDKAVNFIQRNRSNMKTFVENLIDEQDRIRSDRSMYLKGVLNQYVCVQCRKALKGILYEGKKLMHSSPGVVKLNFSQADILAMINEI